MYSGNKEELVTESPCVIGPPFHAMSEPFFQDGTFFGYKIFKDNAGFSCNSRRPTPSEKRVLRKVFLDYCLALASAAAIAWTYESDA